MTPVPVREAIDWPGIRAAAVLVGIRQAARQACRHLPEDEQSRFVERVMKRASREGWLDHAEESKVIAATTCPGALSANVRTGAEIMSAMSADTKLASGGLALRALERLGQLPDDDLIRKSNAEVAAIYTGNASKVHGWEKGQSGNDQPGHVINVNLLCMAPQTHEDAREGPSAVIDVAGA